MRVRKLVAFTALLAGTVAAPMAIGAIQAPAANADVVHDCTTFYYGYGYPDGPYVGNSDRCPAHIFV